MSRFDLDRAGPSRALTCQYSTARNPDGMHPISTTTTTATPHRAVTPVALARLQLGFVTCSPLVVAASHSLRSLDANESTGTSRAAARCTAS